MCGASLNCLMINNHAVMCYTTATMATKQQTYQDRILDANVEYRLASFLTSLNHDVKTLVRDYPHALPDHAVLALAVQEKRVLLTNDRDFGELIFRQTIPIAASSYFGSRIPMRSPSNFAGYKPF